MLSNYVSVVCAHYEELELKRQGKPYSEAVLVACEMFLTMYATGRFPSFVERSLPKEGDAGEKTNI